MIQVPLQPDTFERFLDDYVVYQPLSMREIEVLQLIARGDSNRAIANDLIIAPATVKRHVSNILSKLQATNRTQAVAYAHHAGLLH